MMNKLQVKMIIKIKGILIINEGRHCVKFLLV